MPVLVKLIKMGMPKQSKHAIYCVAAIQKHHVSTFEPIFEVKESLCCTSFGLNVPAGTIYIYVWKMEIM